MRRILYSASIGVILIAGISLLYDCYVDFTCNKHITIEVSGIRRSAILHLPPHMDRTHPYPLVVGFHPLQRNAEQYEKKTQIFTKGEKAGFMVLCPEGMPINGENASRAWNSGTQEFADLTHDVDDVAFVRALLAQVSAQYPVDAKRIYATGFSNGAQMSYLVALKMADVFAAIAPMSGARLADGLTPSRPVPVLHFHGIVDDVYPFKGGHGVMTEIHSSFAAVPDVIAQWCRFNNVSERPTVLRHDNWMMLAHDGPSPVNLVLVKNLDHQVSTEPDAIAMALQFFAEHPMP